MKTVALYFFMVALPLLGVAGLLQLGSQLRPSASVGGTWDLEIRTQPGDCQGFPNWARQVEMVVSQSGPDLTIRLKDPGQTMLAGTLQGLSLTAWTERPRQPGSELQFTLKIDRRVEPDRLAGTLTSKACAEPVWVEGTRQPQAPSVLGEH